MSLLKYYQSDKLEVGVDEVGRGCLFGSVYAASVILPKDFEDDIYLQIKDSKKLSEKKRNYLSDYIKEHAIDWSIGSVDSGVVDRDNIYRASMNSMHKSLDNLNTLFDSILVDGDKFIPYMDRKGDFINYTCIPGGDNKFLSIAAASILAKVARDNWIKTLVNKHPILDRYDLLNNKGYGTQNHLNAIRNYGITEWHRKTFGICKNY